MDNSPRYGSPGNPIIGEVLPVLSSRRQWQLVHIGFLGRNAGTLRQKGLACLRRLSLADRRNSKKTVRHNSHKQDQDV
jgi:hypothetical protein